MPQEELTIAIHAGQAVFSLVLSAVLLACLNDYRHPFLRHWALGWLAMSVHYAASASIVLLLNFNFPYSEYGPALLLAAVATACLHGVWLIMGAAEAVANRSIGAARQGMLIALALAVGIGSVGLTGLVPSDLLTHLSPVHLLVGSGFLVASFLLWRSLRVPGQLSSRLVPLTFGLYGAHLLHLGMTGWMPAAGLSQGTPVLGAVGMLIQILMGFSIVIWLLELERQRSSVADSKARNAEQRLVHFRMHDAATGLPNRRQLQDQLSAEIRAASTRRNRVAVLAIGLHRFKLLSQALGWSQTDSLVRLLSVRLREAAPPNAVLGRIGERDFLLILPDAGPRDRANERARKLLKECGRPLQLDGQEVFLSVSGGLCFAPDDEIDAVALIRIAQQAQMAAVAGGESLVVHHGLSMDSEPHDLLQLERELRQGVVEGQFSLYFQPLVSIRERRITGFETLLRWNHPQRGLLTPGTFLQEAVRIGVLDELEDRILAQALGQLHEWQNDLSLPPISASINLSAQRFQQPDLADKLARLCERMKVDPTDLHIEITESTAMQDFEAGLTTISRLQQLGCKVCLDDFGTGYSSLSHLRRLQVDYVKLDRSFITNLDRDERGRDLTRAIVDLIHSLGMTVLAEGVENRQQLGYLIQCRVDVVQGYLLGRPQPAAHYRGALDRPQLVLQ